MTEMMKIRRLGFFLFICTLVVACEGVQAQTNSTASAESSCRNSVQRFYSWYVEKPIKENKDWRAALQNKPAMFSKGLTQALRNSDAESTTSGDAVLDFDPILATQDMGNRYIVRDVTVDHDRCLADVYGEWPVPLSGIGPGPNVIAELIRDKGRWVFVNFHYPASGATPKTDLLKILRAHYTQ